MVANSIYAKHYFDVQPLHGPRLETIKDMKA